MSSKNTNDAAANDSVDKEMQTESTKLGTVPEQAGNVTVLKDASGKDQVIISDQETGLSDRFKKLIRNKKVLVGLGTFAGLVVLTIIKNAVSNDTTFVDGEYVHTDPEVEADYQAGLALARQYDEEAAAAAEQHTD
jgi:hypothetical protein